MVAPLERRLGLLLIDFSLLYASGEAGNAAPEGALMIAHSRHA
jgi:hypothetical protein